MDTEKLLESLAGVIIDYEESHGNESEFIVGCCVVINKNEYWFDGEKFTLDENSQGDN